jgi:hypothetical protein
MATATVMSWVTFHHQKDRNPLSGGKACDSGALGLRTMQTWCPDGVGRRLVVAVDKQLAVAQTVGTRPRSQTKAGFLGHGQTVSTM